MKSFIAFCALLLLLAGNSVNAAEPSEGSVIPVTDVPLSLALEDGNVFVGEGAKRVALVLQAPALAVHQEGERVHHCLCSSQFLPCPCLPRRNTRCRKR